MLKGYKVILVLLLLLITTLGYRQSIAQTNLETFGQNRLQFRKFEWKYFETKHFRIYHYDAAGKQLARYVSEQVENDIKVIERKMGSRFPNSFKIILYNSYDDYRQTNVGRKQDTQIQETGAATVDLVGDKLVIYFNGAHADLRRQTRYGMARVVMERALFGESFREMVKSAVLMNLPNWTVEGFIGYLIDGWDAKTNSDWNNLMAANPGKGFYELGERNPELAGKAFWKFVSDIYGENAVKNLLYTMQVKTSLNQGIRMTLGLSVKQVYDSVLAFYNNTYAIDALQQEAPDTSKLLIEIKVPKDRDAVIRNFKVSPRNDDVAYVSWLNGEYKVYLQKAKGEQTRAAILDGGRLDYNEVPDPNYPLLAWSNNGYKLAILYKKGTYTKLRIYNSLKARVENYTIPANRFDRVLGMSFMEEDDKLIFSATKKSQADIYQFTIKGKKMVNITNDAWDDLQPWYVSGGSRKGILFLSNRPKPNIQVPLGVNELPAGPFNVYFYNTTTKRRELLQMSDIKQGTITQPIQYGSDNYAFLHDLNGVQNRYVVLFARDVNNMDSAYSVPVTNYPRNIVDHQYVPATDQIAEVVQDGDRYKVYYKPLQIPYKDIAPKDLMPTSLLVSEQKAPATPAPVIQPTYNDGIATPPQYGSTPKSVLQSGNVFQSEFDEPVVPAIPVEDTVTVTQQTEPDTNSIAPIPSIPQSNYLIAEDDNTTNLDSGVILVDSAYVKMKASPYRAGFKIDNFSVNLDNSVLFNRYQSANTGGFRNPSLAALMTVSLEDMLENHRFTGGIRLPINFSGSTYFLQYENFKRRVDWGLLYLRSESFGTQTVQDALMPQYTDLLVKNISTMVQGSATYPFDRIRSVRMYFGGREDKATIKATDYNILVYELTDPRQFWATSRVEYVFDNTLSPAQNIFFGFRYKFFAEYLYKMNGANGGFYNFGVDFRHYQKLYKNIVFANRLAYATSQGNQKVVYALGGVDNWINAVQSNYVPTRPTENYAFTALATNMRGYEQNARNGNNYAVLNSEIRVPVFATFIKRPIQSPIVKNLQVVAFMDAGSAWSGFVPNADAMRNDNFLRNKDVTLQISDVTGGFCLGYGAGLRTVLVKHFIRVDVASNIERRKPIVYLSFGTDF